MRVIAEAVEQLNADMQKLFERCPFLFDEPGGPKKFLLENCSSYGSDGGGGARSKYLSANKRIREHNPRNLDWWCGSHRMNLLSGQATKGVKEASEELENTLLLHKLMTMSPSVAQIFSSAQEAVGDRATATSDRPMFKWGSEYDFLTAESKRHRDIEASLVLLKNAAATTNPDNRRYHAVNLYPKICCVFRILYVGLRRDILWRVLRMIGATEIPAINLENYEQAVKQCRKELTKLTTEPGRFQKEALGVLTDDVDLRNHFDIWDEDEIEMLHDRVESVRVELARAFLQQLENYHGEELVDKSMARFKPFNVTRMLEEVANDDEAADFEELPSASQVNFYCRPYNFRPQWVPYKSEGKVCTAPSIDNAALMHSNLKQLKVRIFNRASGRAPVHRH